MLNFERPGTEFLICGWILVMYWQGVKGEIGDQGPPGLMGEIGPPGVPGTPVSSLPVLICY